MAADMPIEDFKRGRYLANSIASQYSPIPRVSDRRWRPYARVSLV